MASSIVAKINHLWTNGQVERMNRTIKEATVHPITAISCQN
jgi:hypothetical protein